MKKVFFITTAHLPDGLWFRDDEDFRVGMNFVAVQAWRSGVVILAFVLMSNHLHFVLIGTEESARGFINGLKARYSHYLRMKYGCREFLRRNDVDFREISPQEDEALERAIAYVQMNPVAANICLHPTQYPWGTGNVFFRSDSPDGIPLQEYSGRALERLLHSNCENIPKIYCIGKDGFILPESYVDISYVETLFRTPNRLNYFQVNSSKAKRSLESTNRNIPAFRDQTIISMLPDMCYTLFRKKDISELNETELVVLVRQMKFRLCADVNQIARVLRLSYESVAKMLDQV